MTGFGRATGSFQDKSFSVEVRSLNGKTSDVRCKIPTSYRDKEIGIRKIVLDSAMRGKIECTFTVEAEGGNEEYGLNRALFTKYYRELSSIQRDLGIPAGDLTAAILKIPSVIDMQHVELSDEEWQAARGVLDRALGALDAFRLDEGSAMLHDLQHTVEDISTHLAATKPHEEERITRLRDRLLRQLESSGTKVDQNRYEQEILYYLEKLDINEERVRLSQHCDYFLEILNNDSSQKGKKLGFVAQEMGREINTLGAKAQHSEIQQLVVKMKDCLEQIKEQVANVV